MNSSCKKTDYVNVFQGNSVVKTEPREGVADAWHFIKGLSGNTHPGAQLPFGKLSVGCYSGGYPTGYGNNQLNTGDPVKPLYDEKKMLGVAHLQHNGTGAVGYYYNYAVTTAFFGALRAPELHGICDETARPGYYTVTDACTNIKTELTTDQTAAFHRYVFPKENGRLSVDFSNDGLYPHKALHHPAGKAELHVIDAQTVTATVELQGVPLYFCVYCNGGNATLWENHTETTAQVLKTSGENGRTFGCMFCTDGVTASVCVAISSKSEQKALEDNRKARVRDFDTVRAEADHAWETALSRIEIQAEPREMEIFYSNLYHSLVKPSDWSGESFYYDAEPFLVDFTTLWDIYKTQLPLLFTLYPKISEKIVQTYLLLGQTIHAMPNAFGLCKKLNVEANQARLLAGYLFCDAYYRGVRGANNPQIVQALRQELKNDAYRAFFEQGECERTTHTLDLAECCGNLAQMAQELGFTEIAAELQPYTTNAWNAFDPKTGVLKEGYTYYEGNHWNYAFRPMRNMEQRMALAGGRLGFVKLLDRFFGYTDAADVSARFEGFNNETDMETPYAYTYAGRHDRLCEVLDLAARCMFTTGEGGIPGNSDSGGLSSCYLWNVLGIFPVSGQNLMLIGTPRFAEATLHLANDKSFTIKRNGDGIYVNRALLNGKPLDTLRFSVRQMMQGGELELHMTTDPANAQLL